MCTYVCVHVHVCIACMNHFYGTVGVETVQAVRCEATGPVYRMRPLGVHLSLKSWTLWSTREGGERTGVPDETSRCPLES